MCLLEHLGTVLQCIKGFIWGPDESLRFQLSLFFSFQYFSLQRETFAIPKSYNKFCVILGLCILKGQLSFVLNAVKESPGFGSPLS